MPSSPRLEKVTPDNVLDACRLRVRPDQERFVSPVVRSLAEAYAQPDVAWPRLILDGESLVGFVMGYFPGTELGEGADPRPGLWRLTIADGRQGRGYGRFGVRAVAEEVRRRGHPRMRVSWVPGAGGPEAFSLRLGFRPTGELDDDEVVAVLDLATADLV